MNQRGIVDVVCKSGVESLATEIGALLGKELQCNDVQLQILAKDSIFSDLNRATSALTRMTVSGDKEGDSYLITQLDAAIVLGGTLIMLPDDMIEEHVKSGKLDGELNDAFGEVANIIAGVFTQAFVDKYPKSLRFIKKTVEELQPTKIDPASEEPFPPGNYYVASCNMVAGETELGPLEFIVPAAIFELAEEAAEESAEPTAPPEPVAEPAPAAEPESAPATAAEPVAEPTAETAPETPPAAVPKPAFADAKKLTDVVFNATISQIGEEIGALLGQDLNCDDIQLQMISRSDFFSEHCTEKATMAYLKVSGDRTGCGYMFTQIPDAIVLGGTLIMLPEEQITEQVQQRQLEGEVEDAFNEVANILAGGLTQVFLDRYPKQLRFVRTESDIVTPTKIDPAGDEPFPEGDYYLASFAIHMEGFELHRMQLLFPAEIFDLDAAAAPQEAAAAPEPAATTAAPAAAAATAPAAATTAPPPSGHQQSVASQAAAEFAAATSQPAATAAPPPSGPPLVLVISDENDAAQPFAAALTSAQYDCKVLTFQEDIKAPFQTNQILGAILVMSQVSEKGFATAIKLQSSGQALPPLIFAGPEWTRTTVLRAVKYGAQDILIVPASENEIEEKINQHFRKAS